MKQNAIVLGYQQVRNVNVGLAWLQTRAFRCMTFLPIVSTGLAMSRIRRIFRLKNLETISR
ncbi:MAG TPA: hypothetical protein VEZ17_17485 [Chitinophagaceae bacterium]|jgi:hypothetical protein|nr:hypothetical protein [Chitinophagaceae bacterium]